MIKNKNTAFEIFRAMAVTLVLIGHFAALSKDLPLIARAFKILCQLTES